MPAFIGRRLTPQKKAAFLTALAACGNVRQAARTIHAAPDTVYAHRKTDPAFAEAWEQALHAAMDIVLEPEAIRRAVQGVERAVFHRGEQVGVQREYSDTLLIFLLKGWKPDRYKERSEVFHRNAVELLRKLERIGQMSPDELQAFLLEVETYVNTVAAGP